MSQVIQISYSSTTPYQIWLTQSCPFVDGLPSNLFITTTSTSPYQFLIPIAYQNLVSFGVYIIADDGCISCETISNITNTPTIVNENIHGNIVPINSNSYDDV